MNDFYLNAITWSFSSLSCYENCPKAFYKRYIELDKGSQNAFAQWGGFCHSIFERYLKGSIELFDLADIYEKEYDKQVTFGFPFNMSESYYKSGVACFENLDGIPTGYEVIDVEKKFTTEIDGYKFTGIIDLILRKTDTGEYLIIDHKSKSKFTSKKEKEKYLKQLYLYSRYIKDTYGTFPTKLIFNLFRSGTTEIENFSTKKFHLANEWVVSIITQIYKDNKFINAILNQNIKIKDYKYNNFYCNQLCDFRYECEFSINKTD